MAGRGTRLRPHTHTTPKPLLPVAGKMMIERIVETFVESLDQKIEEIAFVLGDFGSDVERRLVEIARKYGAAGKIYKQDKALGTAHAVYCAAPSIEGEVIVAFADTLFETKGKVSTGDADAVIWLKEVENPSSFGVAKMENGRICEFVEKPQTPVSNLAIIGVYYFKNGGELRTELAKIVDGDKKSARGEYELTDAIDTLLQKGNVFKPATVATWLDCGTIPAWLDTTRHYLPQNGSGLSQEKNIVIHEPVYIGDNVTLADSEIGPNVSIESGAVIKNSKLSNCIVCENATISDSVLIDSTVGAFASVNHHNGSINIGDHSIVNGARA